MLQSWKVCNKTQVRDVQLDWTAGLASSCKAVSSNTCSADIVEGNVDNVLLRICVLSNIDGLQLKLRPPKRSGPPSWKGKQALASLRQAVRTQ